MVNSRNKGASGERQVARILEDELGIKFKRNLDQYQTSDLGDLTPDVAIPFTIEVKTYAKGTGCRDVWWEQVKKAAALTGLTPCVIYKYDRRPWRVALPLSHFMYDDHDQRVDVSIETFCYIIRERLGE